MKLLHGLGLSLGLLVAVSAAEKPKLTLLGKEFTLAWVNPKPAYTMNEYVLPGEKVEAWTQLVTVARAPAVPSPAVMIDLVIKNSADRGLLTMKPQVLKRPGAQDENDLTVFLIMKDPASGLLEFSLQRYVKEPGQPGVKTYQYARHCAPGAPDEPKPADINAWLTALWTLKAPVHTAL